MSDEFIAGAFRKISTGFGFGSGRSGTEVEEDWFYFCAELEGWGTSRL